MRTVLVVDDDEEILALVSELLLEEGYWVLQATSGEAALEILARDIAIHLLVTDVVMPGMDGIDLADRAVAQRPDIRVLYVSGFVKHMPSRNRAGPHGNLLAKPWRADDLKREVKAVIGEAAPAP